jgi:hypothetical protein
LSVKGVMIRKSTNRMCNSLIIFAAIFIILSTCKKITLISSETGV